MSADRTASAGLPVQLTPFIGREREIADVQRQLTDARLVTLTGAGGSGKTRLALEVAQRVAAAGGNVAWIELAPLGRPDLLAQHVATQLQVREQSGQPVLETVVAQLRERRVLLVVDNCEHVVDACAALIDVLLRSCRELSVLATSREALGIAGERARLVTGLGVHAEQDAGDVALSDAVRLFVDRACAASASFRLTPANAAAILQICRRLDGLPLAIELAAARIPVLTPEQIAARLDDAFRLLTSRERGVLPRHRTLRATVEWSYRLLAPAEQVLLQRLAVFAGGFTLDDAEHVCVGEPLAAGDLLDLVAGLAARSLLVMSDESGTARYSLLEIVRQYAREELRRDEGAALTSLRHHALHYAALAETALPHLESQHSAAWARRLTTEHDNLRAALDASFRSGAHDIAFRLVGALWWYWGQTGQWSEAVLWFDEALRSPPDDGTAAWGQVLHGAGTWAYLFGDRARGRRLLREAADVLGRAGDRGHQVRALGTLAHLLCSLDEYTEALACSEEAVAIALGLDETWAYCHAVGTALGGTYLGMGNFEAAERCFADSFAAAVRGDHHWGMTTVSHSRSIAGLMRGDLAAARQHARSAIDCVRIIRDPFQTLRLLHHAQRILALTGDMTAAATLCGVVAALRAAGAVVLPSELPQLQQATDAARHALGEAEFAQAFGAGAAWSSAQALDFAFERLGGDAAHGPTMSAHGPTVSAHGQTVSAQDSAVAPQPLHLQAADLSVRAFGTVEVVVAGHEPAADAWTHTRPKELLVHLLCHPEGRTRDQVGLVFWPDASAAQVKNSFHVLLHKLRKALARTDAIVLHGERYRINPELTVWFDVAVFERNVGTALRDVNAAGASDSLAAALALYRADFMEAEAAGDWHLELRHHLRRLYTDGLSALADAQLQRGQDGAAIETLERLVREENLHEHAYRRLMQCLARAGQRDRALRHYTRLEVLLREELGTTPEAETRQLAERIRTASSPVPPPAGADTMTPG